jgi:hypothetical protein
MYSYEENGDALDKYQRSVRGMQMYDFISRGKKKKIQV